MWGINGFYLSRNPLIKEIDLEKSNKKLEHRGPDNQGVFYSRDKFLGLGHTRLSILDRSSLGNQPMKSECSKYVISFNGKIYNFIELKKFLLNNSEQIIFNSNSDTKVILNFFIFCKLNKKSNSFFLKKLKGIFFNSYMVL